jgi:hypothetical protein
MCKACFLQYIFISCNKTLKVGILYFCPVLIIIIIIITTTTTTTTTIMFITKESACFGELYGL